MAGPGGPAVGPDGGFAWLVGVLHEVAHARAGPRAACLYVPDAALLDAQSPGAVHPGALGPGALDELGDPGDICPEMDDTLAAGLLVALADAGLDVGELLEPVRLFFPALGPHQHVVALPLAWDGAARGLLAVAGPVPPLGGAALGRVTALAAGGLGWVSAAQERSARLRTESADRARLSVELDTARLLLGLQESLVAARSTAEVAARLAEWLDAPVAVQLPNLIVAEAAGPAARDLALSAGRSAREKAVLSDPAPAGPAGAALPVLPAAGRLPARVVAPMVGADGSPAGFLVAGVGPRGAELTSRALALSKGLIAYQLSVRQDIERSVVTLRQNLLADLMAGRSADGSVVNGSVVNSIVTQAAKLGHDLKAPHLSLAVAPAAGGVGGLVDRLLRVVEHACVQASAAAVAPLVGVVDDAVVALVPEPVPAGATALAHAVRAEAEAEGVQVVVGVGPVSVRPADLPRALRRAGWAAQILRSTPREDGGDRPSRVAHFDDLGVYGLLFDHGRADELAAFARRRLGALVDYDRKHRSELVETLRQIFRRRSLNEAAAALHIHISTLKYRVSRIEEILGVSLESWDTVFHLELAMRILAVTEGARPLPDTVSGLADGLDPPRPRRRAAR